MALEIVGFWADDVKVFTPVQAYKPTPPPVRFNVVPVQMGELLLAVAVGFGFTVTEVMAVLVQPFTFVTVIL